MGKTYYESKRDQILSEVVCNMTSDYGQSSINFTDLFNRAGVRLEFFTSYCEDLSGRGLIEFCFDGEAPKKLEDFDRCTVKATESGIAVYNYALR